MKFWDKDSPIETRAPFAAKGKRLYAIGDVHGCLDELRQLLKNIRADNKLRRTKPTYIAFLGDIIDRGPHSREVVELLMKGSPDEIEYIFIKGNHEESLLRCLGGEPQLMTSWLKYGGWETAESYGVSRQELSLKTIHQMEKILQNAIPERHLRFLETFVDSIVFGDYFLVHGGVKPGIALADQTGRDLHWIRDEFLDHTEPYRKIIIHGHTVVDSVEVHPNRIAVDTGAYKTGKLSAICLDRDQVCEIIAHNDA